MTTTEIIILVIAVISLSMCIFMFFKANKPSTGIDNTIATNDLKNSIQNLKENLPLIVKSSVDSQMISITQTLSESRQETTNKINDLNTKVDAKLKEITEKVQGGLASGFKSTGEVMEKLQNQMGTITEAQNNIKGLSADVISLKNVLSNNQTRGRYGEMQLEMILENIFNGGRGKLYEIQYEIGEYKDGSKLRPDAVIFIESKRDGKLVCIDSKFSLTGLETLFDNTDINSTDREKLISEFKAALKERIKETSKYIVKEKTLDNAIMFVPNDGIFAFIQNECRDLDDFARSNRVILASPSIIPALLASLRMMQIDSVRNENLDKISASMLALGTQFKLFSERWRIINGQINALIKSSHNFGITVTKISNQFNKLSNSDESLIDDVSFDELPIDIESGD